MKRIKIIIILIALILCQFILACEEEIKEDKKISPTSNKLYKIHKKDLWGFIDQNGKVVIAPKFNQVGDFYEDFAAISIRQKWGFINKKGELIVNPIYDFAKAFKDGLAPVKLNDKYGFIDNTGKVVIDFKYKAAYWYCEDLAAVLKYDNKAKYPNDKIYGFIDKKDNLAIPFYIDGYNLIGYGRAFSERGGYGFKEGLVPVFLPKSQKMGYINQKNEIVIEPKFIIADLFTNGYAVAGISGGKGYLSGIINNKGEWVIKPIYNRCENFQTVDGELVARVEIDDKCQYINIKGKKAYNLEYQFIGYTFSEGLATFMPKPYVSNGINMGYVDVKGNIVIEPKYTWAGPFSQGLAVCAIQREQNYGKYGYIDKTGEFVIEPKFVAAEPFDENGIAMVKVGENDLDAAIGYINTKGEYIWEPTK